VTLRLYNTLSKQEEQFQPLDQLHQTVTFYTCGPTVYDYAHIGNFRAFLNADVLRRTLEFMGHDVIQVMNLTDVGHMTDDASADGGGEDKMQVAAKRLKEAKKEGKLPDGVRVDPDDPYAVAEFYAQTFIDDSRQLGLRIVKDIEQYPERMPRPTQYIEAMVTFVQRLIDENSAYVAEDGVVYFDVEKFAGDGRLSGNTIDQLRSGEGGRVDSATQKIKRHPADFMLWKPDANHVMKWPSPWGEGYPGWHLECSVMALELLGDRASGVIDIHSGGEDNIFPHHECEIAQSCALSGNELFARFWFHTRHLMTEGAKMSKSAGTFYTPRDLYARGGTPAALRLAIIATHYRVNANFTMQTLRDAQRQVSRWVRLHEWLTKYADHSRAVEVGPLVAALPAFAASLESDLNIAGAIGVLNEAVSLYKVDEPPPPTDGDAHGSYLEELEALRRMDLVLGILELEHEPRSDLADLDATMIEQKILHRNQARARKDWAAADRIRDELIELGVAIHDGAEGTTWSRIIQ
jgi:cysteinyl-tRNA synthetase